MQTPLSIRGAAAFFSLFAAGAQAAPIVVDNPGFEDQVHGPNTFTFDAPTGWEPYNTNLVDGESIGTVNPEGSTYFTLGQWGDSNVAIAFIQGGGTSGIEFGIRQTLDETLQADTTYTLTVAVGNIASGSSDLGGGPIFFDLDGFPGYRVELLAGNTLLAADVNSLHSGDNSIPEGEFRTTEVMFDSTGVDELLVGQPLVIGMVNLNVPDSVDLSADREVDFDQVVLEASPTVTPLSGDFDNDHDVDGTDFLAWQRGESPNPLSPADLANWSANYGQAGGTLKVDSEPVPEPTALLLIVVYLIVQRTSRWPSAHWPVADSAIQVRESNNSGSLRLHCRQRTWRLRVSS